MKTSLHEAAEKGDVDRIRLLLLDGIDPDIIDEDNNLGWTPLQCAVREGYPEAVEVLLKGGAHPNTQYRRAGTALHIAAAFDRVKEASLLVNSGAGIEERDFLGFTPLVRASRCGSIHVVELLITRGALVNAYSNDGTSCLMWAVLNNYSDTVQILIERGGMPNWCSNGGATALHTAALKESPHLCKFLVEHGANPNITDNDGRTPKDWAKSNEVIEYLASVSRNKWI